MTVFARAQFLAGTDGTDPATRTITPSSATSLLVAVVSERSGVGSAPQTVSDDGATGGDWAKAIGHDQELSDSNARHSFSLQWKVAGSTDTITVSADDGTGNGKLVSVHEYTTDTAGTWSVAAAVGADTGTGSASPLAIGPTASVAAGDNLVLASINWRTAGDQAYPGTATNSFTGLTTTGAGSNGRQHGTAWKQDAGGGTFSTSIDWTGDGHESAGAIVVFALDGGDPPPATLFPTVAGVGSARTAATNTTAHVITIPAHQVDDKILVHFARDGSSTNSVPGGWASLGSAANSTVVRGEWFAKTAASDSETLTITSGATEQSSHTVYVLRPDSGYTINVEAAFSNGSSTNSDPPALTPSGGEQDYLWLVGRAGDSTVVATVAPTSFTSLQTLAAAGTGGASTNTAVQELAGTTLDPAAFTSASEQWVASTVAAWQVPAATPQELAADAQAQASATAALTGGSGPATEDVSITALDFAVNNAGGSDARLMFVGSNLPPRTEFTITGSVYWKAQTDYTGLIAFFSDLGYDGSNNGIWSGGAWEALFCPHNNDGTYDSNGDYLAGSATERHFEVGGRKRALASLSRDTISSPASPGPQGSLITTANEWTVFIFRCTQVGSELIYTLQPDIRNHPDFKIVSPSVAADIGLTPATPAFSIGAFKWSGNSVSGLNPEAPGARVRGMRIVGAHLGDADAESEALAGERGTDAWATSAGAANGWYINDNPTVADITDKSGAGHTPVWDNAQRPADYSGTLTVPAVGVAVDLAAAGASQASATAALTLAKQLAASAQAQAGGSAGLSTVAAPVDLAAAGSAQAASTAQLLKGVSLSGASLSSASAGASLSHSVPLAASAAAVATSGGQLALAITLGAAGLAAAAASAGLSLAKPLAGSAAGEATGTASLEATSGVELSAAAAANASAGASLSIVVQLSGAAVAEAQASAALQVGNAQDLAASASASSSAGATLWLNVSLGADAIAQAAGGGALTLTIPLAASALSVSTASAQLAGAVALSAAGSAIGTASATLQVVGPISAYARGFVAETPERSWAVVPQVRNWTATPQPRSAS
jgi:hypothetical protein